MAIDWPTRLFILSIVLAAAMAAAGALSEPRKGRVGKFPIWKPIALCLLAGKFVAIVSS